MPSSTRRVQAFRAQWRDFFGWFKLWKKLFTDSVSVNKKYLTDTLSVNKKYLTGTPQGNFFSGNERVI